MPVCSSTAAAPTASSRTPAKICPGTNCAASLLMASSLLTSSPMTPSPGAIAGAAATRGKRSVLSGGAACACMSHAKDAAGEAQRQRYEQRSVPKPRLHALRPGILWF